MGIFYHASLQYPKKLSKMELFNKSGVSMSDAAIIGLVIGVAGGIATLIYYLLGSVKKSLDEAIVGMMAQLRDLVKDWAMIKQDIAVKGTMIEYMGKELESIKKNCWRCKPKDE